VIDHAFTNAMHDWPDEFGGDIRPRETVDGVCHCGAISLEHFATGSRDMATPLRGARRKLSRLSVPSRLNRLDAHQVQITLANHVAERSRADDFLVRFVTLRSRPLHGGDFLGNSHGMLLSRS
jgi:hypothetical protein